MVTYVCGQRRNIRRIMFYQSSLRLWIIQDLVGLNSLEVTRSYKVPANERVTQKAISQFLGEAATMSEY